jgi:cell division protein FtsQ
MSERISLKRGQIPKPAPRRAAKSAPKRSPERMVRVPMGPRSLRRWIGGTALALALVGGTTALWLARVPQDAWFETMRGVGDAGFEVRNVEITGVRNMGKMPVYSAALGGPTNSMAAIDLDEVRDRLLVLPWVADARVARRLPDTLLIDIAERKPAALWQYRQRLALIDKTGRVLTRERLDRFAHLPLIVGPRANDRAVGIMAMLAERPELLSQVDAAILVGHRRWDVRFKTGATLALPEGDDAARRALLLFARMDSDNGLLGQGFSRFDMRLPDRMVVRTGAKIEQPPRPKAQPQAAVPAPAPEPQAEPAMSNSVVEI